MCELDFPPVSPFYYMGDIGRETGHKWIILTPIWNMGVEFPGRPSQKQVSFEQNFSSPIEDFLHCKAHFAEIRPFTELVFSGLLLE